MFLKLFFISLFVTMVNAKFNFLVNRKNTEYVDCIDIILKNIFQEDLKTATILRYRVKDYLSRLPAIKMNNFTSINNWPKFFPQIYIIKEELVDTDNVFKNFIERGLLQPRSWFIYLSNFSYTCNFSFLTKHYIANVFAINQDYDIFTTEPYRYENVNEPENRPFKIGSCKDIYQIPFWKFFSKYPRKWRNTTVYEYLRVVPPFTTSSFDGLEDNLFGLLKERLGFKNQRREVPLEKSTTQLLLHEQETKLKLRENKIDLFGGLFVLRSDDNSMEYSMTPSYILRSVVWMTPNGPPVSELWRISGIFSFEFYLGWILILVVLSIVAKLFFGTNIMLIISVSYKILLEYPIVNNLHLKSFSLKLFASAWILAMLTISALFKNSLLVINATTVRKDQLESLEDILTKSDLKLAGSVNKYLIEILSNRLPDIKINFNEMIKCTFNEECLNRTAFKKDTAMLTERSRALYYYIPLWYRDDNGDSIVHLGSEIITSESVHMIFSKGYPLSRSCSNIILRADASGWFKQQLDSLARAGSIKRVKIDHRSKGVTLDSIDFIFFVWAGGLTLAFIIFCMEIVYIEALRHKRKISRFFFGIRK